MPTIPTIGDVAREVRDFLAGYRYLNGEGDLDGASAFRTFTPDGTTEKTNLPIKAALPQIQIREVTSRVEQAARPAGIGEALCTYTLEIWLYADERANAEAAREFIRVGVRNVAERFLMAPYGDPPGVWENTILGEATFLLVKLTDRFWGTAARLPLTVTQIIPVECIRADA